MAMDFGKTLKIIGAWNTFKANHPKFPAFCKAVMSQGIREDSVVEIAVISPEGERIETNLKVKASDLELFREMKDMSKNM